MKHLIILFLLFTSMATAQDYNEVVLTSYSEAPYSAGDTVDVYFTIAEYNNPCSGGDLEMIGLTVTDTTFRVESFVSQPAGWNNTSDSLLPLPFIGRTYWMFGDNTDGGDPNSSDEMTFHFRVILNSLGEFEYTLYLFSIYDMPWGASSACDPNGTPSGGYILSVSCL